jgi:UDP-hydrolysing UDP-N-acetyl-D-glucosamine 2-epimerase
MSESTILHPMLIVGGAHLSPQHGMTVLKIEEDGFEISAKIEMLSQDDSPKCISKSIGKGVDAFADAFSVLKPDLLLVLGDRFETLAGVTAALPFQIPVAHIHGGELSFGAIDDSMRHAITKMSHLHFASTREYANRIVQLGEEPWRVYHVGAPGLDAVKDFIPLTSSEFESEFGEVLPEQFLLVTYHPATLGDESCYDSFLQLLDALDRSQMDVVLTMPNADSGGQEIRQILNAELPKHPRWKAFEALGTRGYFTAMKEAVAMVGNSSSGIIEAASFQLPVVNVGIRQDGRTRGPNVIDSGTTSEEIYGAIAKASSVDFREKLSDTENLYGDGESAKRIVSILEQIPFDKRLVMKRFHDIESLS